MKHAALLGWMLTLVVLTGARAADPDPSKARIEGVVVDAAGKPVAGATVEPVRLEAGKSLTATSGPDGKFVLQLDAPAVRYQTILASADGGRRRGILSIWETPTEAAFQARIVVKPAQALTVRVLNGLNDPVVGAGVAVCDRLTPLQTGETDRFGLATFQLPRDAKVYQVIGLKPRVGFDYFENYRSAPMLLTGTLPAEVTLTLDGVQLGRVRAVDSAGKPVAGVGFMPWTIQKKGKLSYANMSGVVGLKHAEFSTDADGVAVCEWLPAYCMRESIAMLSRARDYHEPNSASFDTTRPDFVATTTLYRHATLSGKVTRPDGEPAPGVLLQVESRGRAQHYYRNVVRTRADGTWTLTVNPDQSYLIAVTEALWAAPSRSGVVTAEGKAVANLDFRLSQGTLVQGRMTVGGDKKPAADQTITLVEQGGAGDELVRWAQTDKDGRYRFRVGPGNYQISQPGQVRQAVAVAGEDTIVVDFHVERLERGRLTGVVRATTADGKPVAGAIIRAEPTNDRRHMGFEALADDDGRFTTERWLGAMSVYAASPDGALAAITAVSADDVEIKLVATPAGRIQGRLVGGNGVPLAGVRVDCHMRLGSEEAPIGRATTTAYTDATGQFSLGGLLAGSECRVTAYTAMATKELGKRTVGANQLIDLGKVTVE